MDVDQNSGMQILYNQRLHRPVSPHLGIYKWQVTWILSSLNRITGSVLSGGLYVFGALYLAAPLLGLKITAAGMAAGFAKWPVILKVGFAGASLISTHVYADSTTLKFLAKFTTASFFNFHSLNGLRHLAWDAGKQITNVQVIRTGWAVVGLSALLSLGMALY